MVGNDQIPLDALKQSAFVTKYLERLQTSRKYVTPWTDQSHIDDGEIEGPTRLDKSQRRLLQKYNKLLARGELS
jgi:hypothetical protein